MSQIMETFQLNPSISKPINRCKLYNDYEKNKIWHRKGVLPIHRRHELKKNGEHFITFEVEPFDCVDFEHYFRNTYYAICQVLYKEYDIKMDISLMNLEIDIQHKYQNRVWHYSTYIVEHLHEDLVKLKDVIHLQSCRHYSLLMHLLLWKSKKVMINYIILREFDGMCTIHTLIITCFAMFANSWYQNSLV